MLDITIANVESNNYATQLGITTQRSNEINTELLLFMKEKMETGLSVDGITIDNSEIIKHAASLGKNDNEIAFALYKAGILTEKVSSNSDYYLFFITQTPEQIKAIGLSMEDDADN